MKTLFSCHTHTHSLPPLLFQVGMVSALPHLVMTIIVPIGGQLADYLRTHNLMSTTNVRKLMNCGGESVKQERMIVGGGWGRMTTRGKESSRQCKSRKEVCMRTIKFVIMTRKTRSLMICVHVWEREPWIFWDAVEIEKYVECKRLRLTELNKSLIHLEF